VNYPWVITANPLAGPKSRQPANEKVLGALRVERELNTSEHELLNPVGVNCLRAFTGRGLRVWRGRTTSNDLEWKYVNVRRYFNYLGASIGRGSQWAVFEPNDESVRADVRQTVSDFLTTEWRNGGRLVCMIGVALMKPAEFMILRIGQQTLAP
jgi:phage tail sheath protein FI